MAADTLKAGGIAGLASLVMDRLRQRMAVRTGAMRRTVRERMAFDVRPHMLARRLAHVHGPAVVPVAPDELITVTVVRNGRLHVKSFMEHHQALGVAHSVFLDNGSTDDTIERLCSYDRVTVLSAAVPYSRYENAMKWYLVKRFASERWSLCVDIDELFDYPLAGDLALADMLRYLDARKFTAVVAQMLDMFSGDPLSTLRSGPDDRLEEHYPYYDISNIDRPPYEWSEPSSADVRMHWGGIRRTVFGTNNGLTKAALIRLEAGIQPFVEWHHVTGARVADITCLLRHYPFVSTFYDKVQDAVRSGRYGPTTSGEYDAYARALAREPQLTLRRATATRYTGLEPLIESGFLAVSAAYRAWITRHPTTNSQSTT